MASRDGAEIQGTVTQGLSWTVGYGVFSARQWMAEIRIRRVLRFLPGVVPGVGRKRGSGVQVPDPVRTAAARPAFADSAS